MSTSPFPHHPKNHPHITNSQEGTITYQYNSFGEPIKIADNNETKEITYSNFGEVIKEVTGLQTNSYQYDEDGNLIKHIITDKDLEDYVTEYSYNKSGLVTAIKTGMGTETITYDKAGRIKEKANDVTGYSKSYSYYKDNTIRDIKTRMDGNLVYYENFGYDKNGNKIYDDQNGDIRKYTYDGLNRLTGAEIGNVRTEYEFDSYNNISREYEIIGAKIEKKSYYYDNANRLLLEDSNSRTVQYEYDNSGNLIKKITGIGNNAETSYYRYDGYNRLSEFIDDYSTAEYEYNINGLRESKTVNGTKTRYIYKGADIVGEIFDDNIYTYYRASELIGYTNNKGDRYYYRQNSHGDVTALLTVDGQEKKTYSYNAYGKENPLTLSPMGNQTVVQLWKAETEQIYNPFRYCGEYQDAETGLIYLRNRYYDNSIGRFITEDPIKDGLNWYVYCGNNPVMFVDPLGLNEEKRYVVVIAAGINTDSSSDYFYWLKNEIQFRIEQNGDSVRFLEVYPYGEASETSIDSQIENVIKDLSSKNNMGGDYVNWKITEANVEKDELILMIGHSGGGVAVVDAYSSMDNSHKKKVIQVITIGSPSMEIKKDGEKFTVIRDKYDAIPYINYIDENGAGNYHVISGNASLKINSSFTWNIFENLKIIKKNIQEVFYYAIDSHVLYFDTAKKAARILNCFWGRVFE